MGVTSRSRRAFAAVSLVLALVACSGDDDTADVSSADRGGSPTAPDADGPPEPPMAFRPVLELRPAGTGSDGDGCQEGLLAQRDSDGAVVSWYLLGPGIDAFNELAAACFEATADCPTRQLGIVVADEVMSAPTILQPSFEHDAISISGDFTESEARDLAVQIDRGS